MGKSRSGKRSKRKIVVNLMIIFGIIVTCFTVMMFLKLDVSSSREIAKRKTSTYVFVTPLSLKDNYTQSLSLSHSYTHSLITYNSLKNFIQ